MDSATGGTRGYSLSPKKRGLGPRGVVLGLLLAALLIHFGWYLYERWRFAAAVDAIHERGEPVLVEEFNEPRKAHPNDPAPYWRDAAGAVGENVLGALKVNEVELPLTEREKAKFREMVDANAQVLPRHGLRRQSPEGPTGYAISRFLLVPI